MDVALSTAPPHEVFRISDPESTCAVTLVQPLIQTLVQELTMLIGERLVFGVGVAVEADVRVNIAFGGFVLDFCAELH